MMNKAKISHLVLLLGFILLTTACTSASMQLWSMSPTVVQAKPPHATNVVAVQPTPTGKTTTQANLGAQTDNTAETFLIIGTLINGFIALATISGVIVTLYAARESFQAALQQYQSALDQQKNAFQQTQVAEKDLTLTAYANAVQGIIAIKDMFANRSGIFLKQIEFNPSIKTFIPQYMQGEAITTFLTFASGFWRFSYIFSVMNRWKELGLTKAEHDGLEGEMRIWLEDIPGFYDVYKSHIRITKRHNPEFLAFLETLYKQKVLFAVVEERLCNVSARTKRAAIRCDRCQKCLQNVAYQHLLTRGGYITQVFFCPACETDFQNFNIPIESSVSTPILDKSKFVLTCPQQTQDRLIKTIERWRTEAAKESTNSSKAITCDWCGKELPSDNGFLIAYHTWRQIDKNLVQFHFDEQCFQTESANIQALLSKAN